MAEVAPRRQGVPVGLAVGTAYAVGMFMSIMDSQIVNVALATLSRQFAVSTTAVQWVVLGYLLGLAACIPASGWVGDRFGTRRTYLVAMGLFTVASAACAMADSLATLVAARALQGIGGGLVLPLGLGMLYRTIEPARRVRMARSITRVTMIAPATAPIIGGALVTHLSWHWIFIVNLPVGAAMIVFGWLFLPDYRAPRGRFDARGLVLGSLGLTGLIYAVSVGPTRGWAAPDVLACGVVGLALLAAFVRVELWLPHALLRLHLLRDRLFRRCCMLISLQAAVFFSTLVFTVLYLQEARGLSALESGLTTFPEAIGIAVSSQVVARLYPRFGPRRLVTSGFLGLAVMTVLLSRMDSATGIWTVRVLLLLLGAAVSLVMLPNQASAFATISGPDTGHASTIFTTIQRSAAALGVAILSTTLSLAAGAAAHPPAQAFRPVFLVAAGLALCGAVIATGLRDADAASTMVRAPKRAR